MTLISALQQSVDALLNDLDGKIVSWNSRVSSIAVAVEAMTPQPRIREILQGTRLLLDDLRVHQTWRNGSTTTLQHLRSRVASMPVDIPKLTLQAFPQRLTDIEKVSRVSLIGINELPRLKDVQTIFAPQVDLLKRSVDNATTKDQMETARLRDG